MEGGHASKAERTQEHTPGPTSHAHVEFAEASGEKIEKVVAAEGKHPPHELDEKQIEAKLAQTIAPPDGGWGWVIVLSSFLIHVIVDGITYTFGVIFVALVEDFDAGKGDAAWILSIFVGITLGTGPIASGLVNLYGCRVVTMAGAIIGALGFILSPFAPALWFLYLSFGVIAGFGFGLIYLPAIVIVSYYFEKRRALATGLACCGSGFGTFVFAPLVSVLVDEFDWKDTCYWLAGFILQCVFLGALFRPLPLVDNVVEVLPSPNKLASQSTPAEQGEHTAQHQSNGKLDAVAKAAEHSGSASKLHGSVRSKSALGSGNSVHKLKSVTDLNAEEMHGHQLAVHIPLHRKDVFYTASLQNIPLYNTNRAEYVASNMSLAHSLHQVQSHGGKTLSPGEKSCCGPEFTSALKETVDVALLKEWTFLLFIVSNFCTNLGFNAPFLYIPDRALEFGLGKSKAAMLVSILGVANTVGRVVFGYLADLPRIKPHRLYMYNTGLVVAGVATVFSFAESYWAQILYVIIFGVAIGCYVSLTAVILVDLLGVDKLTSSFGMTLLVQGVSVLIGPPACGWIYDATGNYMWAFGVTGVAIALSGVMLYFIPCLLRLQHRHRTTHEVDFGVRIGVSTAAEGMAEEKLSLKHQENL